MLSNRTPSRFKGIIWRLTGVNFILVTFLVLLSSIVIYNTACFLVEQMPDVNEQRQTTFNEDLYTYLVWISPAIIIIGTGVHFYLTKKMLKPVRELVSSTKVLRYGQYPEHVETNSSDEIGELAENFNQLIDQLKRNEAARDKMLKDLAHELRTPLSNINGYLEAMKNGVIEGSPKLYGALHKESERLIGMINQLDDLNERSLQEQSLTRKKEWTRADELLAETLHLFRWEMKKRGIACRIEAEEAKVYIHQKLISQAVMNLLQNAVQYYSGEGEILLEGKIQKETYKFSVTGPGEPIPAENREWLFERFYKVDGSRNTRKGGSGLGLAIVKELVTVHHSGEIGLDTDGKTHSFWFTIPLEKHS
ncbi:sensor histidine kinase [Evansella clarkii]|uniref:sensor histidine kinase n=1 Tax=Evansella clarkii TaxID=79879 RepID=UPI0009989FC1|nr:HAMP domain-containing sensor histidine kinase [Evansella clarkii]